MTRRARDGRWATSWVRTASGGPGACRVLLVAVQPVGGSVGLDAAGDAPTPGGDIDAGADHAGPGAVPPDAAPPATSDVVRRVALDVAPDVPVDIASCIPACGPAVCGPDGCDGSCGTCQAGAVCTAGVCTCADKVGKQCDDGKLWWKNACGTLTSVAQSCPGGCVKGASVCKTCASVCNGTCCGPAGCQTTNGVTKCL